MVLVDTSVWIRFLAGRTPYVAEMDRLLANDDVMGHELVYGELLIGDSENNSGGRAGMLALYARMQQAQLIPHDEVARFARSRGLQGRGAGWIDIHLLASALVQRVTFWTADLRLAVLADELGIRHRASA